MTVFHQTAKSNGGLPKTPQKLSDAPPLFFPPPCCASGHAQLPPVKKKKKILQASVRLIICANHGNMSYVHEIQTLGVIADSMKLHYKA